jgi:ribosome-binding protein aMBF1 (putative translation factor)
MICELCRHQEATIHIKNGQGILDICSDCRMDIQASFSYFIGGNEVVKEEYEQKNKGL